MPRTSEVALNAQLAEVLRGKHPLWRDHLHVEQTGVFPDHPRLRPDILVQPPNAQPVVVETEYAPAATVEHDAETRLGLTPLNSSDPIEQTIAVRIPVSLRRGQANLPRRIAAADFDYCVLSGDPASPTRLPATGWLTGGIDDIVRCIEFAMVSQRLVDESMMVLEQGVRVATRAIQDAVESGFTDVERDLGAVLNQHAGEQTNRMAMTIVANALTFHSTIAGTHDIPSVAQLRADRSTSMQLALLDTWRFILDEINYWPIFKVASDLLAPIRAPTAQQILGALVTAADRLAAIGVTTRHDLSGRMFQNLIIDRKFLATFYTLPTSAALLAELAVDRMPVDWTDLERYADLRIADLSCGTGTLLSAAYHSVLTRYRHAGGDDRQVHRAMIERAVVAADIMPAAAHLCASQLSSVHPTVAFDNTRVYTMPYGIGTGDERFRGVAIGSLDLIDAEQTLSLFSTGQRQATGAQGDVEVNDINLPMESVDLVIMNPPFTRPTNHESTEVPVPSFAGFRTSEDEQRAMADRLARIRTTVESPAGHGNAGLASNFIDLAHVKVKTGGTIAFVLPIAAVQGTSWQPARDLLNRHYGNVAVVTIATSGSRDRAFSADTGMAEALIVATKRPPGSPPDSDALFVNLRRRPSNLLEAVEAAKLITRLDEISTAGHIDAGGQQLGSYIRAPVAEGGCAALREAALAHAMIALKGGELTLPRYRSGLTIPVAKLGDLGERGLLHRDIGNRNEARPPFRGPFRIRPLQGQASYPVLWSHDARRERCLLVPPDSEGEVRSGCDDRAVDTWQTATRLHLTLDFQINSQSLAACLTPEPTLGGRAWPNFRPAFTEWQEILALWANSTLGLMCFWWAGSRQQQGRSVLTITGLPDLIAIDPRELPAARLEHAAEVFARFRQLPLLPANEAYRDATRHALDRALLIEILELPEDVLEPLASLRQQWCSEPSVHGGKSTAPQPTSEQAVAAPQT
jgi:predicted RNA methylase